MKTLGKAGSDLIKEFEQLKLVGYLPTPNDVPTIGWGSTHIFGCKVILKETITQEQAQAQFDLDVATFVAAVNKKVAVPLTQNQFDALVSLVYNIGEANFASSTLLKMLNGNRMKEAKDQFVRWNKQKGKVLNGLTRRRERERDLFVKEN